MYFTPADPQLVQPYQSLGRLYWPLYLNCRVAPAGQLELGLVDLAVYHVPEELGSPGNHALLLELAVPVMLTLKLGLLGALIVVVPLTVEDQALFVLGPAALTLK